MKRGKGDVAGLIRKHLKHGQIGVDVGAAVGDMTREMLRCVGDSGRVIAIEADPQKTDKLRTFESERCSVRMIGVGEGFGMMPLFRPGTTAASRWHGWNDGTVNSEPIEVPYVPLDSLIDRADVIKIDAQGSEAHILDGATALLDACPVWILELWPWGLETANRTVQDVTERLRAHGLTPRWSDGVEIQDDELIEFSRTGEMRNIIANKFWNITAIA